MALALHRPEHVQWKVVLVEHPTRQQMIETNANWVDRLAFVGRVLVCIAGAWFWLSPLRACSPQPAERVAEKDVVWLQQGLEMYLVQKRGRCPADLDELERAGIVSKIAMDPWGARYAFRCSSGLTPYVVSSGADGLFGTEDDVDNLLREP